jgi:phage tail protein X
LDWNDQDDRQLPSSLEHLRSRWKNRAIPEPPVPDGKPEEPPPIPAENAKADAINLYKLKLEALSQKQAHFAMKMTIFRIDYSKYTKQHDTLNDSKKGIRDSIAANQHTRSSTKRPPKVIMLKQLKEKNAPTNLAHELETLREYQAHLDTIKSVQLNSGINDYQVILAQAVNLKLPDVSNNSSQAQSLLTVIHGLHPN